MSANVDLVRSVDAAWQRGDFRSVEWADPDIEFAMQAGGTADGRWTGLAGMAQAWRDYLGAWKGLRVMALEYRELDDERVLVLLESTGEGKLSGIDLARAPMRGASLFTVRDGHVTQLINYGSPERAFDDLGLSPESAPRDSWPSSDNVGLVVRAMRAATQLPKPDVVTLNELFARDHVWVPAALESDDEWVGAAGYRDWRNQLESVLPTQGMQIDGAVDFGPRVVVVAVTFKFGGRASGVPVAQHFWFVMIVRDGKIKRTEAYTEAGDAATAIAAHLETDATTHRADP